MKLLVLLLLPCLSLGELSPGFGKCNQFFLGKKPPQFTPLQSRLPPWFTSAQEICQCLLDNNNQPIYLYATLYNTNWKIPVYSAYVFNRSESVGRCDPWYIEPQLDGYANAEACMAPQSRRIITNQAVNCDYYNSGYDRGHLYPVQHTYDHISMLATSTLTNAAPQDRGFNRGAWRDHEADVIDDLVKACDRNSVAYVVTGVVPDQTQKMNNRVTVSKYYWRATCCLQKNSENQYTGQGYFGPFGNNKIVKELSIEALQAQLAPDYGVKIKIFPSLPAPPPPPPSSLKRNREVSTDSSTDDNCNPGCVE